MKNIEKACLMHCLELVRLLYIIGSIACPIIQRVERRCTVDFQFKCDYVNNECPSVSAGLKSSCFWIIIVMLTFSNCNHYLNIVLDLLFGFAYKEIGQLYNYNDGFLTNVGCIYALVNGTGRIFWGTLYENHSFERLYLILLIGQVIQKLS